MANRDYVSEVVNTMDEPILARYIRIHPVEWVGHIAFRLEFYGCFSGKLRRLKRKKLYIFRLVKDLQNIHKKKHLYASYPQI